MDIGFNGGRHLPVDDERNVGHINSSSSLSQSKRRTNPQGISQSASKREKEGRTHQVGRNEDVVPAFSQALQRLLSLLLVLARVKRRSRESRALDILAYHVGRLLLVAKDDHGRLEAARAQDRNHTRLLLFVA